MDFVLKAVFFIIILGVIVVFHEGGHFLVAKKRGIGVREFSVGFGPRVFKKSFDGTLFTINLFPLGGACIFEGENYEDDGQIPENAFYNASVWSRLATIFAGPFCNFILAFFLSLFVIGSIGFDSPQIAGVMDGYPAQQAGLQAGDVITKLGNRPIVVYRDISAYTMFFQGKETRVEYVRDGEKKSTVITPVYSEQDGRYLFGIKGAVGRQKGNPLQVIRYSAHEVVYWINLSYESLGMIFQGRVKKDDFAGPVGVAQVVGDVYDESKPDGFYYVWLNMMNLTILLSANLGVMNLLPIPALDGGRLVICIIEIIRRKKMDRDKEAAIQFAGMMVLLSLMVFFMINDVGRFFR